jgi:hypothetical protein
MLVKRIKKAEQVSVLYSSSGQIQNGATRRSRLEVEAQIESVVRPRKSISCVRSSLDYESDALVIVEPGQANSYDQFEHF